MASAHHAVSGELSMRDERRPGLDGPGRMVKSREFGPQNYVSYENWGFSGAGSKIEGSSFHSYYRSRGGVGGKPNMSSN